MENISKKCDFVFRFESRCDGEKLIKMEIGNKNVAIVVDFITDIIKFFRKPFDGSDVQKNIHRPNFNNYPPMVVSIKARNICAIMLSSY